MILRFPSTKISMVSRMRAQDISSRTNSRISPFLLVGCRVLAGQIPKELGALSKLRDLRLRSNNLTGEGELFSHRFFSREKVKRGTFYDSFSKIAYVLRTRARD